MLIGSALHAQSIALTFDDGPDMADNVGMTAAERNAAILEQLAAANVKSMLFVTRTDADDERNDLIREWGKEGHAVANHTATHPDFDDAAVGLKRFERELLACDAAIRTFPGYTKRFRFPYLKEGETRAKRDGFRRFLKSIDYRPAPVSVDTSDWYYSARLRDRLKVSPSVERAPYRDAYLRHLYDRASYYDGLSKAVLGRSVPHVILMHHNLINALFLADAIRMFRDHGWRVIDPAEAFEDPVYSAEPDIVPAGESILWALAKQRGISGLRWPGEDDTYEKPILDKLMIASQVTASAVAQSARSASHRGAVARYAIQQQYALGGPGGWDYLTIDAAAHRLYISRADRVLVMDTQDGSIVATIPDTQGVHGVALAPEFGEGFTSNGRAGTVTVFDLNTIVATKVIAVGGHNPDAILYDTASKHVYTFNGESRDISVIDPKAGTVIATLAAGGKPEFARADGTGRIFFNIEDRSQIGTIDSLAVKRLANWVLPNCVEPTGLAFDVRHERLFSVCGNGVLVVTDSRSGRHVAEVPIGKGPDAAAFDAQRGLIFSSNGEDGTLTVIHEADPDHYSVIENVATQKSARTMALDEGTHQVYLVAAEFGTKPLPSADQPHPRAPVVQGSFKVLVVGN